MRRTKDAIEILNRITGDNGPLRKTIEQARVNLEVAQMIYDARTDAGLSQRQLADMIGSKQPVIARLEDADYEGHSLTMLQRIAEALDQTLELRFVPSHRKKAPDKLVARLRKQPIASVGKRSRSRS